MRLSEWRARPPAKEAAGPKVAAVVDPVLASLGADPDPHCWIAWGDEPATKFTIFVPTEPGLIACFVRVNVPGDGPRASTKLIRWSRVSIGELSVETQAGHRMLSFQLESQILRGADAEADRAAAFALRVIAAIDGRPLPPEAEGRARRGGAGTAATAKPPSRTAKAAGLLTAGTKPGAKPVAAGSARAKPAPVGAARAKASSNANR